MCASSQVDKHMQLCVGFWAAPLNRSWVKPRGLYGCLHVPIRRCDSDAIWQQPGLMGLRMVRGRTARPPCRIHGVARCPAGIVDSHLWTHWDLSPGLSACEADVMPLHHVPHVCTFTSRQGTCNYVWASGLRP